MIGHFKKKVEEKWERGSFHAPFDIPVLNAVAVISSTQTRGRVSSHLVHHIRKQMSHLACLAKRANDNFTALHKKLLEVANED